MSNKVYDILNLIARLIGPIATFVSACLMIWNVPYAEQITETFAALEVLVGAVVVAAKRSYDKRLKNEAVVDYEDSTD